MRAEHMAFPPDPAHELGVLPGPVADHEEGGPHTGGGQQIENLRGPLGMWAVIEGQGHLAGPPPLRWSLSTRATAARSPGWSTRWPTRGCAGSKTRGGVSGAR